MPAIVSDIHEITVLIGLVEKLDVETISDEFKFEIFLAYAKKFGKDKIHINQKEFLKNVNLFNRGIFLANELSLKFNLRGEKAYWVGADNRKSDSSDLYSDGVGISLKDSSKIVRNNGFDQLLKTFCRNPIKKFKDPFWEFSPSLSADFIQEIIDANYRTGFLKIESNFIFVNDKKICKFDGAIDQLLSCDLDMYARLFSKGILKTLVKNFSMSGDLKKLFNVRKKLVEDVQKKVIAVLREGWQQNQNYVSRNLKTLLQFSDVVKLFGFSSTSLMYAGKIPPYKDVEIEINSVYTEKSKLTERTTGLQINIYTDIEIKFCKKSTKVLLQNQLRYKHRTFSCAPEANLHILNYQDWKKIYPDEF